MCMTVNGTNKENRCFWPCWREDPELHRAHGRLWRGEASRRVWIRWSLMSGYTSATQPDVLRLALTAVWWRSRTTTGEKQYSDTQWLFWDQLLGSLYRNLTEAQANSSTGKSHRRPSISPLDRSSCSFVLWFKGFENYYHIYIINMIISIECFLELTCSLLYKCRFLLRKQTNYKLNHVDDKHLKYFKHLFH